MLAQPAATPHDRAVRWRQLVELAARAPSDGDPQLFASALEAIGGDRPRVDERVRVATALAIAWLPLPAELVALLAADSLTVAAPVLSSARLTASEWRTVAAGASRDCATFISSLRSELPAHAQTGVAKDSEGSGPIPSIGEVVARIDRLRQARHGGQAPSGLSQDDSAEPRLFRWECNEAGEIDWVEGIPRGALVGQTIAQEGIGSGVDRTVERAFRSRAPFRDGMLELPTDAAIGGSWKISGMPAFERSTGRFAGYRGVGERPLRLASNTAPTADPDSLRELAHEIKTPLNAIIGFAEIIMGEYLGPAGSRYRERASEIVGQARLLLGAIEDLDFAAKIHSSNGSHDAVTNLGALAEGLVESIRNGANGRGVRIEASRSTDSLDAAIQSEIAERLILRMCSAVVARAADGETLHLSVDRDHETIIVSITRPEPLAGLCDNDLFGTASNAMSPGFPLRLARGLAQTAGASLIADQRGICLAFPSA